MRNYLLFLVTLILFSCQEEITLDLPQAENKIVVEGTIEAGYPPYIILTESQGYFEEIDINTYQNLFIIADTVKVWYTNNTGKKETRLLERLNLSDSLPPIYTDVNWLQNWNGYSAYEFSQEGRKYYLEIVYNNQIITSETTIPQATPLDCLWVQKSETADKDFKCEIRAVYSDPANQQNNILIKSKRTQHYKRKDSLECLVENTPDPLLKIIDAGSDVLVNGESFETYFPRPNDNGFPTGNYNSYRTKTCNDSTLEFKEDIVIIKFSQIDEPSLKFWRGLVRQSGTNGNPFSEPMNLVSNIKGGFGVFTGYGSVYYKVPIVIDTTILDTIKPNIIDIF
ncbi:MAG: hypothetical protein CMD08_00215 [Flavobacteriales bacterium]|nr:hypothetical protein [Flavobacteriales bacterium]